MTLRRFVHALLGLCAALLPSGGAFAQSGTIISPTNVKVVKPLELVVLRNMDFGTIAIGNLTTSQTIRLTASGRTCGDGVQVACTGAFATAQFQVTGTNNQVVSIRSGTPTATLTSAAGARLTLTPIVPGSVTMPNSGNSGVIFEVGGTLEIARDTPEGLYSGTIDIQVSYQ